MSNQYIPKERLTAYERWEMAAFDEEEQLAKTMAQADAAAPDTTPDAPAPADLPPPAPAISDEELAAIRQQAFDQGRAAGFEAGMKEGHTEGYASGETLARSETARLAALATNFSRAIEESETLLADGLLTLSLDIAGQVLRTSLRVKPELILPAVRDAIAALANPHGHPNLLLNPEDAALVRQQLGEQLSHTGWRILDDPQIARGGCRIENGGAEIDATLPTRWHRVVDNLGQQSDWLDPP